MSDLVVAAIPPVLPDPETIEKYADPSVFMEHACERAKSWLVQAVEHGHIDQIVETKAQAEAIRVYQAAKGDAADAALSAQEIVRRCERGIGLAIRKGQDAGEIAKRGDIGAMPLPGGTGQRPDGVRGEHLQRSKDFADHHELHNGIYPVTDGVTDEQFDEAIDEARTEKNLSRANVKRKVKGEPSQERRWEQVRRLAAEGHSSRQIAQSVGLTEAGLKAGCKRQGIEVPADRIVGKTRRIDANRIITETVNTLDALAMGLGLIDLATADIDPDQIDGWVASLAASFPVLRQFHKQLKEMTA